MKRRKIVRTLLCLFIGVLLGITSYYIALIKLSAYYDGDHTKFNNNDVINVIFVNEKYKILDYIDEKDVTILMLPIVFLFLGMILSSDYLFLPQKYYCFIGSRNGTYRKLLSYIYGTPIINSLVYSLSYIIAIYSCAEHKVDNHIFTMIPVYSLFLLIISRLSFIVHQKYNGGIAMIIGMLCIVMFYMADMYIERFHILLYDNSVHWFYNIMTLAIIILVLINSEKFIIKRRTVYVT